MTDRQVTLLKGSTPCPELPAGNWPADELIARMRLDKKSEAGKLQFVLPTRMGHDRAVDGVSESLVGGKPARSGPSCAGERGRTFEIS